MTSIAEHGPGGENKPPTIPALDLTPTGRMPHAVKAHRTDTTAHTAVAALDAALMLRKAIARLSNLYGTEITFQVSRNRAGVIISPRDGQPVDRIEILAGDIALLIDGDLHPEIDPVDLSIALTATGVHGIQGTGALGVWLTAVVPDHEPADGGEQ